VAVAAAIIASQAMISGAFAILSQSQSLGCFPRVKIVHTSAKYEGQVYIPEANYTLMIACVLVTVAFKTTDKIGNAYGNYAQKTLYQTHDKIFFFFFFFLFLNMFVIYAGIAVVSVMIITTSMLTLIMLVIWKISIWWIALFFVVFASIEGIYLSSVLYKFIQGGFLPLVFAFVLSTIMAIWHYVHVQRYTFELRNKVSKDFIEKLATNPDINRVPGMGLLYSELVQGIPPIFPHFVSNIPSIHSVLVFVSIKPIPISKVVLEERFLFRQVEPRDYHMFRCVVRYGYNDVIEEPKVFERQLVEHLKEFIHHQHFILEGGTTSEQMAEPAVNTHHSSLLGKDGKARGSTLHVEELLEQPNPSRISSGSNSIRSLNVAKSTNSSNGNISVPIQGVEEEMKFVQKAMESGVVYLLGEAEVVADQKSSLFKKIVVNYAYNFLRKNFRQGEKLLSIPHTRLLRVGMTYEI
jgi:KUP system potassium uptake protein